MTCWEYKSVKFLITGFMGGDLNTEEFDKKTNENGLEGWELVSCFETSQTKGVGKYLVAVFKRPRQF